MCGAVVDTAEAWKTVCEEEIILRELCESSFTQVPRLGGRRPARLAEEVRAVSAALRFSGVQQGLESVFAAVSSRVGDHGLRLQLLDKVDNHAMMMRLRG